MPLALSYMREMKGIFLIFQAESTDVCACCHASVSPVYVQTENGKEK
jgi:hypothetical protein